MSRGGDPTSLQPSLMSHVVYADEVSSVCRQKYLLLSQSDPVLRVRTAGPTEGDTCSKPPVC